MRLELDYTVTEFSNRTTDFTRQTSGVYADLDGNERSFLSLWNDPKVWIEAVRRDADSFEFSIGDIVYNHAGANRGEIISFEVSETTNSLRVICENSTEFIVDISHSSNATRVADPAPIVNTPATPARPAVEIVEGSAPTINPNESITPVATLQQLQQRIEASYPRAIRFERLDKRRTEGLSDFIARFFTDLNLTRNTIYVDTANTNREVQTPMGKRRSLGDIYMLCRYYYPTCTIADIINFLCISQPAGIRAVLRTSKCKKLHKRVWYVEEGKSAETLNTDWIDEYGRNYDWYVSQIRVLVRN